jgi:hypothetical protein
MNRKTRHLQRSADAVEKHVVKVVLERLSRPDAPDLLLDPDAPDLAELHMQAAKIRADQERLGIEAARGLSPVVVRAADSEFSRQLAELDARMAHVSREPVLGPLVRAADLQAAWQDLSMEQQRAVIEMLFEVTLLRGKPGGAPRLGRPLDPSTIRIVPLA